MRRFSIDRSRRVVSHRARRPREKDRLAIRNRVQSADSAGVLSRVDLVRPARARAPQGHGKTPCYQCAMMNSQTVVEALSSPDLLSATRKLVHTSRGVEVELL